MDTRKEMMRPAPAAPAEPASEARPSKPEPRAAVPRPGVTPSISKILAAGEGVPGLQLSTNYQRLIEALAEQAPRLGADASLPRIFAVAEGFPGLRLSENYQRLMDALVEVETNIAEQRMLLNHKTNEMSTALSTFPAVWYNHALRFEVPTFYAADLDTAEPIKLHLESQ
jgi:hypothetical protein